MKTKKVQESFCSFENNCGIMDIVYLLYIRFLDISYKSIPSSSIILYLIFYFIQLLIESLVLVEFEGDNISSRPIQSKKFWSWYRRCFNEASGNSWRSQHLNS